jgi:hypothetical protein
MLHLSTDRLAALADEQPAPEEAAHLALCAACAEERVAFRTLVAMAHAERASLGLPLTRWESIAAGLALDASAASTSPPEREGAGVVPIHRVEVSRWARRSLQIAAGLLLVAGGAIAGRASVDRPVPARQAMTDVGTRDASDSTGFLTVEEARLAQQRSEMRYRQAAAYLAQHDSTGPIVDGNPVAYRSRLAALDQVISTTRAAMREAPHDPVINGYYLNTLGQREATLRQLNTVLPASLRLNSF